MFYIPFENHLLLQKYNTGTESVYICCWLIIFIVESNSYHIVIHLQILKQKSLNPSKLGVISPVKFLFSHDKAFFAHASFAHAIL